MACGLVTCLRDKVQGTMYVLQCTMYITTCTSYMLQKPSLAPDIESVLILPTNQHLYTLYKVYDIQCTMHIYTVQCTMYNIHMQIVHRYIPLITVPYTVYICTVNT